MLPKIFFLQFIYSLGRSPLKLTENHDYKIYWKLIDSELTFFLFLVETHKQKHTNSVLIYFKLTKNYA